MVNSIFSFLRNLHTVFRSGCAGLHSHQIYIPFTPSTAFIICRLLVMAILSSVRWDLIAVLLCISVINSDVEHLFVCLLARCVSFDWDVHFLLLLLLSCMNSVYYYVFEIKPLWITSFANIFSKSVGFLLVLFVVVDDRGWDGWMALPTRWTWVCAGFGSWWWTGRPSVLQSMGSQRVGHNWATELNCGFLVCAKANKFD